ncbi:MAG: Type 1 glutamine amidotransferase-like domain-containing protein [Bacilli bacterium]|nr:Type 1 glutamine amidotransferase-like domain-containing protein [Bacilli bacterium]
MKIFICGGGSGIKTESAIKKLNEVINHDKPILYVPLAMNEIKHPYDGCYLWAKEELSNVDVPYIEMVRTFEEFAQQNIFDYSAVFIGGGNTYKLLDGIKKYGIFEQLKEYIENDGIIFGGSAGGIILGQDIDSCSSMDNNDVKLIDTKGFDVLNGISIFAHYTNFKKKFTEEENRLNHARYTEALLKFSSSIGDVIGLPEENTIFIDNNHVEVIGTKPCYLFQNGLKMEIDPNNFELTLKNNLTK